MLRLSTLSLGLGFLTAAAQGQPAAETPTGHDYKIACYYQSDDPTGSLKYQIYDVSQGQYDAIAVDRWFRQILDHHPNYGAYIRDLTTRGLPGATEAERLKLAIAHETERWARLQRAPSEPIPRFVDRSSNRPGLPGRRLTLDLRTSFDRPAPGSPGGSLDIPASPFPYPYRSGPR